MFAQLVEDVLVADQDRGDRLRLVAVFAEHLFQAGDLAVDQRFDGCQLPAHALVTHVTVQPLQGCVDLRPDFQIARQKILALGQQVAAYAGGCFGEQCMHGLDIALYAQHPPHVFFGMGGLAFGDVDQHQRHQQNHQGQGNHHQRLVP